MNTPRHHDTDPVPKRASSSALDGATTGTLGDLARDLRAKGYRDPESLVIDGIKAVAFFPLVSAPRWVEAPESMFFGMRVLDAEVFCGRGLLYAPGEVGIAVAKLLAATPDALSLMLRGRSPEAPILAPCLLAYPGRKGRPPEGAQYTAANMESLWNVFLLDEHLYFTRSWTGALRYRAKVEFRDRAVFVGPIEMAGTLRHDPSFSIRQVDFLIKTLLYQERSPAPLPEGTSEEATAAALASFTEYGRLGIYSTREDSTEYGLALNGSRGRFPKPGESVHAMAALRNLANEGDGAPRTDLLRLLSQVQVYVPFLLPEGSPPSSVALASDQRIQFAMHPHESGRALYVYTDRRLRLEAPGGSVQFAISQLPGLIRPHDPIAVIVVDPAGPVSCTLTPDDLVILAGLPNG